MRKGAQVVLIVTVGLLAGLVAARGDVVVASPPGVDIPSADQHQSELDTNLAGFRSPTSHNLVSTIAFTTFVPEVLREVPPCTPGAVLPDTLNDVPFAHVDVALVNTQATTRVLQAVFYLRDLPEQLTYDRAGVPRHALEYGWAVDVDRDSNIGTGCPFEHCLGADYEINAAHFVFTPDSPVSQPIADGLRADVWFFGSRGYWEYYGPASFTLDTTIDVLTMTGEFPFEILPSMRLFFFALDHNPGGVPVEDTSSCRPGVPGSAASGPASGYQGPLYRHP